jgi:hypothetical protein
MTTFIAVIVFVLLAMAGLGIGLLLGGRSVKGHCNGAGCAKIGADGTCEAPELSVSTCKRTIHLPGS